MVIKNMAERQHDYRSTDLSESQKGTGSIPRFGWGLGVGD